MNPNFDERTIRIKRLDEEIFNYCKFRMFGIEDDEFKIKEKLLKSELMSECAILNVSDKYLNLKIELYDMLIVDLRRLQYKADQIKNFSSDQALTARNAK